MANFFDQIRNLMSRKIVRNKVPTGVNYAQTAAGNFASQVFGTKLASSIYEHNLQNSVDRIGRIRDYDLMDTTPIVSNALNVYSYDATSTNEKGEVLSIITDDERIEDALTELYYERINVDFNLQNRVRKLCKYGDAFDLINIEPKKGITGLISLPTSEIEREEAYDGNPSSVRFKWISQVGASYEEFQVIHYRLLNDDNFYPYGRSVLEAGRIAWKKLQMLEDAMLIYRVARAAEKRVFQIEVGNLPPEQIGNYIEQQRARVKTDSLINPQTGEIDLRFKTNTLTDDFWFAKRGDMMSTIDTLPGGQNLNDIEDVQYVQQQLISSLGVPKAFLQFEDDLEGKSSASKVDMRFARSIMGIQKVIISELNKLGILHLYALGFKEEDLFNFELKMHNPSAVMELGKLEIMTQKFETYDKAVNQFKAYSVEKAKKEILEMTDDDIIEERKKLENDAKFTGLLTQLATPQPEGGMPGMGGEAAPEGGEQPNPEEDNDHLSKMLDDMEAEENTGNSSSQTIKQQDRGEFSPEKSTDLANDKINDNIVRNKAIINEAFFNNNKNEIRNFFKKNFKNQI
jgi:hypothetical protein